MSRHFRQYSRAKVFRLGLWLLLAIALLVHAVASFYSMRQFDRLMTDLRRNNQPVSLSQLQPVLTTADALMATDYHAAAATLYGRRAVPRPVQEAAASVLNGTQGSRASLDLLEAFVTTHDPIFPLLDRAQSSYEPSAPIDSSEVVPSRVAQLIRLNQVRLAWRISVPNWDAATNALISDLQLRHLLHRSYATRVAVFGGESVLNELRIVVTHGRPSMQALARVSALLAALSGDELVTRHYVRERTLRLANARDLLTASIPYSPNPSAIAMVLNLFTRPWELLRRVNDIRAYDSLISRVGSAEWPGQFEVLRGFNDGRSNASDRQEAKMFLDLSAKYLAELRCAAVFVAAEQYRNQHNTFPGDLSALSPRFLPSIPIDPFTGVALRTRRTPTTFTVYSIGPDRQDNLGAAASDIRIVRDSGDIR